MKKERDARFSCKRSGNAGSRSPYSPFALLLQYTLIVCPPKFCITFVFNFSWVMHSSQEKLKIMLTVKHGSYLRAAFISLKAGHKARTVLTVVILRSNPALRTPHYYGQFALSIGKESPYIFSWFNPLNTDTFSGPLKSPINGVWLDFRIRLWQNWRLWISLYRCRDVYSGAVLINCFLVSNAGLMQGWCLFE